MSGLFLLLPLLLALVGWSALGCFALRDFAYSRLEELCEQRGVPARFRTILLAQDRALFSMRVLLNVTTLALAGLFVIEAGPPNPADPRSLLLFGAEAVLGILVAVLVGNALPWIVSRVASERFLFRWWPVMNLWALALTPLWSIVTAGDRFAHRLTGREEPDKDDASVIGEEIRTVVDEGTREGVLEQDAGAMIERVMEFQDEDVGAVMTPRTDMDCVQADATLDEARRELVESGHSRMPVIGESTDDILGILYAKDLLKALEPRRQPGDPIPVLRDIIREPVYVPITTAIPALLNLMRRQHVHIAMVNDEYGGVAGLVTMEDILEEIVGEIQDEYDDQHHPEAIAVLPDGQAEVDGRVHLDDLNERLELELPEDQEFDTIGGFVFSLLGRMPTDGAEVRWKRWRFTVLKADKRQIKRLRITPLETTATAEESPAA